MQTPERLDATLELVRQLRPDRISLFSFACLPELLPLQRKIAADDLPSPRQRITMLEAANHLLTANGYDAISQFTHLFSQNQRDLKAWSAVS